MAAESEHDPAKNERLPFEPSKKRSTPASSKAKAKPTTPASSKAKAKSTTPASSEGAKPTASVKKPQQPVAAAPKKVEPRHYTKEEMTIPQVVSQRMIRRVAGFCGVPTTLGIITLIASYLLVSYTDIKIAPIVVLLVNMGLFGLGVLGITYGVLSASWDEDRSGGALGWQEFKTNWGRMKDTWRETQQKNV